MRWSLEQVGQALGATPPSGMNAGERCAGVSIDSRTIARGELFFAIRGPRHDGHQFAAAALAAASAVGSSDLI